jgi:EKC/KEOPS complex subunit CGI121/TPRKB
MTGIITTLLISLPQERAATLEAPPVPKTRTHNLHSELLMALSPNNNITDAIRRHGVGDDTTRLAVVRYGDDSLSQSQVWDMISGIVKGELKSVDELDAPSKLDWKRIDKVGS